MSDPPDLQHLDHIPTEPGQIRVARLEEHPSRVVVVLERITDMVVIKERKASMVALVSNAAKAGFSIHRYTKFLTAIYQPHGRRDSA